MTKHDSSHAYRQDIDGLRAFAVLSVVIYHAFPELLPGGFVGVDVFFVISGYLISGIILNDLERGTFTIWNFYNRRIRRIFPALITVLASALIFGWLVLFPDEYRALGKHVFGGASFIANFLFWQEAGYFDAAGKVKPLLHLWSLGIEEQFYIAFPLLLWCCAKKRLRIAAIILALCLLSFADNIWYKQYAKIIFYSPLARAWELLAGAVLCTFMRRKSGPSLFPESDYGMRNIVIASAGLVCLGASLFLARDGIPWPGWHALLPVAGTLFFIAAGPGNPVSAGLLTTRWAVFTGLVSYPFYLWHWVLLSYAFILRADANWTLRVWCVIAAFILAVLTWAFVEKPIRFGGRARQGKIYALLAGMIAVGAAGLHVWKADGLPDRADFRKISSITQQLERVKQTDADGLAYTGTNKGWLEYCKYMDAGADETVAIIGDSHAASAFWGVAKLGRELGWNTALLGWIIPAGEIFNRGASVDIPRVFDILRQKKDIRKVFICARGTLYMEGTRVFPGKVGPAEAEKEFRLRTGYDAYAKSLQNHVDKLREEGKIVFIIAENPELPVSPRDYIARPLFGPSRTDGLPKLRKSEVMRRQGAYLHLLSEIRNATVIHTIAPMCPDGDCLIFTQDSLPLYWDDDHLSFAGSEFQAMHILKPYLTGAADDQTVSAPAGALP